MSGTDQAGRDAGPPQGSTALFSLVANPATAAVAVSALGFGIATYGMGLWLSGLGGVVDAMRTASPLRDREAPAADPSATEGPVRSRGSGAPVRRGTQVAAAMGRPDDLKRIDGIGPKLETVLNRLGISTYAQIAGLSPVEVDRIEERLGSTGRVMRDRWIEQAAAHAAAGN